MPLENNSKQLASLTLTEDSKQDATKAEKIFTGQRPIVCNEKMTSGTSRNLFLLRTGVSLESNEFIAL